MVYAICVIYHIRHWIFMEQVLSLTTLVEDERNIDITVLTDVKIKNYQL